MATTTRKDKKKYRSFKKRRKSEHFVSLREISDDRTSISSTRWAFASVIKFDIIVIFLMVVSGLVSHFVPSVDELSTSFYGAVTALLGVLTGLVSTTKAMQGFETKKDDKTYDSEETSIVTDDYSEYNDNDEEIVSNDDELYDEK